MEEEEPREINIEGYLGGIIDVNWPLVHASFAFL